MSELPTRDQFAEHLKEEFLLKDEEREFTAILDRVSDLKTRGIQESFSLFFSAPGDSELEQKVYTIAHAALGEMELFLVPVALDERGLRMEAVFNRLTVD